MSIAIIGDPSIHLSPVYDYVDKNGRLRNYLLEAGLKALKFCFQYCVDSDIKTVIILGDFFELKDKLPNCIKNPVISLFNKYNDLNLFAILGNHDYDKHGNINVRWLEKYFVDMYNDFEEAEIEGLNFAFIPYSKNIADIEEFLFKTAPAYASPVYVCGHFDVKGLSVGINYNMSTGVNQRYLKKFKKVFLGHIHMPSIKNNLYIAGSTYQLDWNELLQKHFFILDKKGNVKTVMIPKYMNREIVPVFEMKDIKKLEAIQSDEHIRIDIPYSMLGSIDEIKNAVQQCRSYIINYLDCSFGIDSKQEEVLQQNDSDVLRDFVNEHIDSIEESKRKPYRNIAKLFMDG